MNPPNYVDVQRSVNAAHMNGRMEAQFESARAYAGRLAKWIKMRNLPATSFLDAGCRTGYAAEELAFLFPAAQVTGVDIVPEFIHIAELRCEAVVGDMQALPFADEEFDWTFSCTSIEHCPDIPAAVRETQRVSKYGFYIHTDLETAEQSKNNISHFANHENPTEWVDEFKHPDWWLVHLNVPRMNRIEMIWLRKQFALANLLEDTAC